MGPTSPIVKPAIHIINRPNHMFNPPGGSRIYFTSTGGHGAWLALYSRHRAVNLLRRLGDRSKPCRGKIYRWVLADNRAASGTRNDRYHDKQFQESCGTHVRSYSPQATFRSASRLSPIFAVYGPCSSIEHSDEAGARPCCA